MKTPLDHLLRALACTTLVAASLALLAPAAAQASVRIKDVASVQGVRSNQLTGYGLVVGLDGTGDRTTQAPFTTQSIASMLQQMGVTVPPGNAMQLRNVAAVVVTAELPAFAQPGQPLDVVVSSMGNAKSLRGGTLIATPLKGADGQIYAMAQGNVVVAGAGASGGGSSVQVNALNTGRVPAGATVEQAVETSLAHGDTLQLDLKADDYSTARNVQEAINRQMGGNVAQAINGRAVQVRMPATPGARVAFLASIENLPLQLEAPAAKVVINARTGSVVLNQSVTLGACAVAHGNLSVTISAEPVISQPGGFSQGQTVVAERADIRIEQQAGSLVSMPAGTELSDVVKALNALGATPQDLLAILQAMKSAGALYAEIEVI